MTPEINVDSTGRSLGLLLAKTAKLSKFLLNSRELGGGAARALSEVKGAEGIAARVSSYRNGREAGRDLAMAGAAPAAPLPDTPRAMGRVSDGISQKAQWRESLDTGIPTRDLGLTPPPPKPKSAFRTWLDKRFAGFGSDVDPDEARRVIKQERALYT